MDTTEAGNGSPLALTLIEQMLEQVIGALQAEEQLTIQMTHGPRSSVSSVDQTTQHAIHRISFPGSTAREAWKFAVYFRVLELVHEALIKNTLVTKRQIFYEDPKLFNKQSVVDRCVDNLAHACNMPRRDLNVVATAKGLAYGAFSIAEGSGGLVDGSSQEGMLIHDLNKDDDMILERAKWILVIEKEAVFRSLVSSKTWRRIIAEGIMITGKGYPDLATRALLKRFTTTNATATAETIPCFGLVDYDPDGLAILLTYQHGSQQLNHENSALSVPHLQWLGPTSDDIGRTTDEHRSQVLLPLSARDRRLAVGILSWPHVKDGVLGSPVRHELQVMLMLNIKFEIQMLDLLPGDYLINWLEARLKSNV